MVGLFGHPPAGVTIGILVFLALCLGMVLVSIVRHRRQWHRIEELTGRPHHPGRWPEQPGGDENSRSEQARHHADELGRARRSWS
jgi:hypothetical protein